MLIIVFIHIYTCIPRFFISTFAVYPPTPFQPSHPFHTLASRYNTSTSWINQYCRVFQLQKYTRYFKIYSTNIANTIIVAACEAFEGPASPTKRFVKSNTSQLLVNFHGNFNSTRVINQRTIISWRLFKQQFPMKFNNIFQMVINPTINSRQWFIQNQFPMKSKNKFQTIINATIISNEIQQSIFRRW